MFRFLIGLSVEIGCLLISNTILADNFLLPIQSSVCLKIEDENEDIQYKLYDKAAYIAVKTSDYMYENVSDELDDHSYNILAYELADKALEDISITSTKTEKDYMCVKLTGNINKNKADVIIKKRKISDFNPQNVTEIVKNITETLPTFQDKSLENNGIPLIYIENIEFYNHTSSSAYKEVMTQYLSLEPNIFVIEDKTLADYILIPRVLQSKNDKIDDNNSRYNMSVELELQKITGETIDTVQKNRYIIVSDISQTQIIAQKLLLKLMRECIQELSAKLNKLS